MKHPEGGRRVTVVLPPHLHTALEAEVRNGRFGSVEEAVLAGVRLVAGLGPRAIELLKEGASVDDLVHPQRGPDAEWMP